MQIGPGELIIRDNIAFCKTSIKAGAGYNVTRVPLDKVKSWNLVQVRFR